MSDILMPLEPELFGQTPKTIARIGTDLGTKDAEIEVSAFTYPSGIAALRIETKRGHIIVLPFLGQMIWQAVFDGRNLGMGNLFEMPRAGSSILDSYGAFAYHAGLLHNGTPGPEDHHALHGEMPLANMESAWLVIGEDPQGAFAELHSQTSYSMGFGAYYKATPRLRLYANSGMIEVEMVVENRSAHAMELMYMLHANFDFVAQSRIRQPVPFDATHTKVRANPPSHVTPSPAFLQLLTELGENPARMEYLHEPELYTPEQVFYIKNLPVTAEGCTAIALELPQGDAFALTYRTADFPHCVRWILNDGDAQVAAFALPSTCEPEGYSREKAKGNIRMLAPKSRASFPARLGYLSADEAPAFFDKIDQLAQKANHR